MKAIRVFKGGLYPAFENEDAVREQNGSQQAARAAGAVRR
jgi:hypothetical protein